jgi:2-oxoisovalerate dehydrogenase E2 component (dihydrolipoyl transacylase)
MATDILMPQLGESVTEGTIVKWLKQPGDKVEMYEPICEVATDKVTAEVPSTVEGTMQEIVVPEGETVAVGELICRISTEGEAPQPKETAPAPESAPQPAGDEKAGRLYTSPSPRD